MGLPLGCVEHEAAPRNERWRCEARSAAGLAYRYSGGMSRGTAGQIVRGTQYE